MNVGKRGLVKILYQLFLHGSGLPNRNLNDTDARRNRQLNAPGVDYLGGQNVLNLDAVIRNLHTK